MKCNAKLRLYYFSVNVSVLAVVFRRQILKNRQFCLTSFQKKTLLPGTTTLVFSNEDLNIMKIVKSLEESGLLIKGVIETNENKVKKQKEIFLGILAATLAPSLLLEGKEVRRAGKGSITAGQHF